MTNQVNVSDADSLADSRLTNQVNDYDDDSWLSAHAKRTFIIDSDYSGIEAVREAFERNAAAIDKHSGLGLAEALVFRRTCDINDAVCDVLVQLNMGQRPQGPCRCSVPLP